VGSSYPPERAAHLGSSQKSLFLDAGCVAKSDYVNELFGSCALAPSKAFKKEAIAACRARDGKGSDIFDVDDDETQLLLDDRHPQLLCPQDLPEVATISQSSRCESRYGPVSASKAQFGTVTLPLNGMPLVPAPQNLEIYHMSSYLNGAVGSVAPCSSVQKLPARDLEVLSASRNKRPAMETEIGAVPEFFDDKLLKCKLLCQVVAMIDSHEDEYNDAIANDPTRVRLDMNGNDTLYFSPLLFWPKAVVSESEGEPIQNSSCTIDFIVLSFISQPLFNCNPTTSHCEYFMMKVSTLPAPTNPKNRSKCIGGLIFFFLLCAIMDVMLIGTTTLAGCANHAERRYLCYAFKCGLPFGEFRKLMQHQQATRYSNYSNAIIWQQCKHARYTLQNEVLPHYNQVGSGVSWREQLKQD
jgi:hypothetical protein